MGWESKEKSAIDGNKKFHSMQVFLPSGIYAEKIRVILLEITENPPNFAHILSFEKVRDFFKKKIFPPIRRKNRIEITKIRKKNTIKVLSQ